MPSDDVELPKWEWDGGVYAQRNLKGVLATIMSLFGGKSWEWRVVGIYHFERGTAPDAASAARACEDAVVAWAEGLVREIRNAD